jgi:hypothetical protein
MGTLRTFAIRSTYGLALIIGGVAAVVPTEVLAACSRQRLALGRRRCCQHDTAPAD